MQKLRKLVNVGVPLLLLLLGIFFFFTKDFPTTSIGGLNSVGGFLSDVDSLKNAADYWQAEASKSDTVIIKVPTYVYVDRPISIPIQKNKVFPKEIDLNDFDLEDVSKGDEVVASVPVKTTEKDYGSFLELPYDFTLKNEGVSFDGLITADSFTIKNLLIASPYEVMPIVSIKGDYEKRSVVFRYSSPYLKNLNISYTEKDRLSDKGLKKVKRKAALKGTLIGAGLGALTYFIIQRK
jgi:hypothetical protein